MKRGMFNDEPWKTDQCRHTKIPAGFLERAAWMEKKSKTHVQKKCRHCGRFAVWVKK